MLKKPAVGRPRVQKRWASMMRYVLLLDYTANSDVHTALHMAGVDAPELIKLAVHEYIVNHNHPAGLVDVQANAVAMGLGLGLVGATAIPQYKPLHQAPVFDAKPPSVIDPPKHQKNTAPAMPKQVSAPVTVPVAGMPTTPLPEIDSPPVSDLLRDFARAQLEDS